MLGDPNGFLWGVHKLIMFTDTQFIENLDFIKTLRMEVTAVNNNKFV
jgi:hypothetical protein